MVPGAALRPLVAPVAHGLHGIDARQAQCYHWSDHHRVLKLLEEGLAGKMGVVLTKQLIIELHHLHTANLQTFFLKHTDDFSCQSALHGARLNKN